MGLFIWNSSSDPYNSEEQAENWAKVDQHDHTPGKGALITTGAIADAAITSAKLSADAFGDAVIPDGSVTAAKLASDAVETAKIVNANVTDAKLASPNSSVYRTLLTSAWYIDSGIVAGTYSPAENSGAGKSMPAISSTNPVETIYLAAADYSVSGKNTRLRLRAEVHTSTVAPAINYTFHLYPITSISAGTYQLGTSAASVAINTPGANTLTRAVTADFALPSDNTYVFAVVTSGTSSAYAHCYSHLQLHHT